MVQPRRSRPWHSHLSNGSTRRWPFADGSHRSHPPLAWSAIDNSSDDRCLHPNQRVVTEEGAMHIQEYFVRRRCEPRVKKIQFDNIASAQPAPGVLRAILEAGAVIICPSNPFISIGPILAVPGLREALQNTAATIIAITPIIGGRALKGPAADMLRDLGHEVSALGVAAMYRDFVDVFVLDEVDSGITETVGSIVIRAVVANTLMNTIDDKRRVARTVLQLIEEDRPTAAVYSDPTLAPPHP